MRHLTRCLQAIWHCAVVVTLLAAGTGVRGEVGIVVDPGTGGTPVRGFYLGFIGDGPDPVPGVWSRYSQRSSLILLNEEGAVNGDGPPTMLWTSAWLPIVAWSKNSPTGHDVVLSRYTNGAWSAPEVLAGSPVDDLDPVLVQGPDGWVHLFYWEAGAVPRIMYRKAPADLSSWTAAVEVSEPGVAAARPAAVFHQGTLHLAYEVHDHGYGQTPRQVVVAHQDGENWVREVVAISYNVDPMWPEVHSRSGRLWVEWIESPGQMFWTRCASPGAWEPVQMQPYVTQEQLRFFVRGTIQYLAVQ